MSFLKKKINKLFKKKAPPKKTKTLKRKNALPDAMAPEKGNRKETKKERDQRKKMEEDERKGIEDPEAKAVEDLLTDWYRDPYYVDHPVYGRLRY